MNLRPYQKEGARLIWDSWMNAEDILMYILATGGGKTEIFIAIIKKILTELLPGETVMLIAHRQELILQAHERLKRNTVFSGIIMAKHPENFSIKTQVCSIQTIIRRKNIPAPKYIIIDEGHHAQFDNSYGEIIKRFQSAKVLLVTASPYRLSGDGFERIHPYKPTKMILGRNLKQLQEDGWLVPLRYYAAAIPDLTDVHIKGGDYVDEEALKAMQLVPIVDAYFDHAKGKCGVVFAINIQHSINIVQQFLYAGVNAAHLDANTPDQERKKILEDFKAGIIKIIVNVGIITEGFDFPDLEFVQLARPTKSLSLFLQMVGRVTRARARVDEGATAEERKKLIAESQKPWGIVLDCAGCLLDHKLPAFEHDWEFYFKGSRKFKKSIDEEMEMLVYVAEDEKGNVIRTRKPKEIEGMKLIEITNEQIRKVIQITSVKELDRIYSMMKRKSSCTKPGYVAYKMFMDYCQKNRILVIDVIWEYIHNLLIKRIDDQIEKIRMNRSGAPGVYPLGQFAEAIKNLEKQRISRAFLKTEREKYEQVNAKDLNHWNQMQANHKTDDLFSACG
jgi:superfamily II DNA or RNA helicase